MDTYPSAPMPEQKRGGAGALIGIIIVVIILIVGALYLWGAKLNSGSDEVPDIEADLQDLEANVIGSDLESLGASLEQ